VGLNHGRLVRGSGQKRKVGKLGIIMSNSAGDFSWNRGGSGQKKLGKKRGGWPQRYSQHNEQRRRGRIEVSPNGGLAG